MATNLLAQIERLWANLRGLGVRRLSALGLIGLAVFAATGLAGYYLSRPTMETLYSGLDRDDISAIGAALREAGVPFDVNAESTVVLTPAGQAAAARMILAEKGLPRSGAVGNELYDKLGSLGLTSFMQDVTRLRALEGELARTIQMMRTVKAARVHIVLADEGSFRRERQPSSASVVIRADGGDDRATGQATGSEPPQVRPQPLDLRQQIRRHIRAWVRIREPPSWGAELAPALCGRGERDFNQAHKAKFFCPLTGH